MVSLVDIETSSKPRARPESRRRSYPRSLKTPYPRFSDARVGYRFYDKNVGHWTTMDPLGNTDGLNQYAFCSNNSFNFVDALGLLSESDALLQLQHAREDVNSISEMLDIQRNAYYALTTAVEKGKSVANIKALEEGLQQARLQLSQANCAYQKAVAAAAAAAAQYQIMRAAAARALGLGARAGAVGVAGVVGAGVGYGYTLLQNPLMPGSSIGEGMEWAWSATFWDRIYSK